MTSNKPTLNLVAKDLLASPSSTWATINTTDTRFGDMVEWNLDDGYQTTSFGYTIKWGMDDALVDTFLVSP